MILDGIEMCRLACSANVNVGTEADIQHITLVTIATTAYSVSSVRAVSCGWQYVGVVATFSIYCFG